MTSPSQLESCFTCLRRTDNFLCITEQDENSGEAVEAIFVKHFWFTKTEYQDRTVCTSCWEKIDEFHKFYCEVERVHALEVLTEIKTEEEDDALRLEENTLKIVEALGEVEDLGKVEPVCKVEIKHEGPKNSIEHEDSQSDNDVDNVMPTSSEENSNGSDSDVPLARRLLKAKKKRKRALKKRVQRARLRKEKSDNDELNVLIRQHMDITCHKCSEAGADNGETFDSFYRLRVHFKKEHDSYGYIVCCNRKWATKTGLAEHLQNHEPSKADHSRCVDCNCIFKDKSSYANHMFLVHTPEDQKQFKCDRCSKAFAAEDLLNSHLKWHEEVEKKNHYCEKCNKYFLSARNLENHNLSHHNFGESSSVIKQSVDEIFEQQTEEHPVLLEPSKSKRTAEDIAKEDDLIRQFISLNCSKCDFVGETFNKLSYHALKVHNMNSHAVICCDRRFGKRQRLYEHCLRHLNPDHFKCDLCGKTYADSSGLQIHKWWIHTPASERPFKCDICGAAFVKDYLLKQHTNWHVNKERKKHYCEICNKAYSNSLQLRAHHQKKHGAVCDWVCDVCAKGFIHRALLEEHRLTHTEEGLASLKIQCEKCQRWLINKKSYLRHRRRCYDTSGPIKCDICGKESANEAALAGHKNFHHSNRPLFRCSYCGKECKTQLRLKEHEATHTGVVLYQCPYCPRTSNSSSNMYTHKKSAHPEKWQEEVIARSYTR